MKTICIYHSIDLDGWMSAAIVKHWFNSTVEIPNKKDEPINTLDFIGYNYGEPIPDLSDYDKVIMCDITFKLTKGQEIDRIAPMFNLIDKFKSNFIWIDHHISAMNDVAEYADEYDYDVSYPIGIRDTKFAACELTWKYFFPNETMPEIVRLLGRYDCFGHKGTEEETKVLEFQYGARQCISNHKEAYYYLKQELIRQKGNIMVPTNSTWEYIHNQGKAIYTYLCTEAKQIYKNGFGVMFYWAETKDYGNTNNPKQCSAKFICINKERFNPINFGIDYHADGYDGAACFHRTSNGDWVFSLYNDNDEVDCSAIAKQYGGGGHKGAAGFRIKDINLIFN